MRDAWSPDQYQRFRDERAQPFLDLLALVMPRPQLRALDLGCGTGELTSQLHHQLGCRETLGVDSSAAMLGQAAPLASATLRFELGDIAAFEAAQPFDLVLSNAAVQWVPDHPRVFERLRNSLAPGGQLAVQMPANHDFPSHVVAAEIASREPFQSALGGYQRHSPVLTPEVYAQLLHDLGFVRQSVRLQVYGHLLDSRSEVVEWVKGTLLTDYERRLPAPLFSQFLATYREALLPQLSPGKPYFYPFKRLLLWAQL
jgi:trans-aconitate 2-methyltransferase